MPCLYRFNTAVDITQHRSDFLSGALLFSGAAHDPITAEQGTPLYPYHFPEIARTRVDYDKKLRPGRSTESQIKSGLHFY